MDYTCFEGMTLPFLLDESSSTMDANTVSSSASNHLLEAFHAQQQQQLNQSYNFYNPQLYNFPAVSWSTTDPTLLLTDQKPPQQNRSEFLYSSGGNVKVCRDSSRDDNMEIEASCIGLSSFPTVQQLFHSRSGSDLHHHAGVNNSIAAITAEQMNLHGDMITMSGRSNRRDNAVSSSSSASSIDPFSFCVGGGGGSGVNAPSSQSQWMQQMCSLSSDQYYSCVDALMMPKLVSDHFTDSPQLQQQPCSYYTSSTSVNCLHEADSCGSSDRDRTTSSEEINRMNNSNSNNSGHLVTSLPNLHGCVGCDSVTGLILSSSVPLELSDELSSSIAAAADEVELATTPTLLDHGHHHHHHHRGTCGSTTTTAAPSGRVSWMSPGIGSVQTNSHVSTTLDPMLLLGSAATTPTQQQLQFSNGLLSAPRSSLGTFKPQHRAYLLDCPPTRTVPFSFSTSQNCSSSISPRYSSVYSMPPAINPGLVENCTTSGSSFYKHFHSFSSRPQEHGVAATSLSGPAAGGAAGVKEFNVGGGFESRKDYCSDQMTLLSASRKPNTTSIEPQSVAARHRRKKISERVRILEKLIPGGNKMDTASMLDEAIDYVKFLQLQVQLLESMGEPETLNMHGIITAATGAATEGGHSSFITAATTQTTTSTNCSAFHPHSNCNVDSSALIGGGFGSSHHLSSSSALMQHVTIAAATATPKSTSTPPLILSEVLQEQLFKQKLCLVSLQQYCPQGRRSSAVGSMDWAETNKDRASDVMNH